MKRQRLKKEHERLHGEWITRNDLLARLIHEAIIETDASVRFKLEKKIEAEEVEIKKLGERLEQVEQSINSCNSQMSVQLASESQHQDSINVDVIPLKSENGVDYRNLRDLLKAEKWREANKETWDVMLIATNRERKGWIDSDSFKKFPCKEIQIIDQLWITASNGHFGFSVQMKIWEECGSPIYLNDENWRIFLDRIGWKDGDKYSPNPKFNPAISPLGELPLSIDVASYRAWDASGNRRWEGTSFFQRFSTCSKY
jgi:GUN4-like